MKPITYYQMANRSDEEVKEQFIVRLDEYEQVISEIERDEMTGSIQHYIFIGPRGSGKTTLLRRVEAEVNTDSALRKKHVTVNLREEQAGVYRFADILDMVSEELATSGIEINEVDWQKYGTDFTRYAKDLYLSIQSGLRKKGKKLVLLIDNIDRVFTNLGEDQQLFRELLINHKDMRIIGASARMSEHHWQYDEPFYEFFSILKLEPLTINEIYKLLDSWSNSLRLPDLKKTLQQYPGKLQAIRAFTDGMPRSLLYAINLIHLTPEKSDLDYLKPVLDQVTPVFQERIWSLPPSLQKVLFELSFFWNSVKVKTLADKLKMESKNVSALLKQLVDLDMVVKSKVDKRNYAYRVKDRFFNFWLVFTQGTKRQRDQLKYLSAFYEFWYSKEELQDYYPHFSGNMDNMNETKVVLMTKLLSKSGLLTPGEKSILLHRFNKLPFGSKYSSFIHNVSSEALSKLLMGFSEKDYDKAEVALDSLSEDFELKEFFYGIIHGLKKDYEKSVEALETSHKRGVYIAKIAMGYFAEVQGNKNLAVNYYIDAERDGIVGAELFLARLYSSMGRNEEAKKSYQAFGKLLYSANHQIDAFTHLGLLELWYEIDKKSLISCLSIAGKNINSSALFDLLHIYYAERNHSATIGILRSIEGSNHFEPTTSNQITHILSKIWIEANSEKEEILGVLIKLSQDEDTIAINWFLENLLIHFQTKLIEELFLTDELGSKLMGFARPIFFASKLLRFDKVEEAYLDNGYPPEMKSIVVSIVRKVKSAQKRFYKN